jgi:hypothetical protein
MRRLFLLMSLLIVICIGSCGPDAAEKADQATRAKSDSIKEQKKLDSLFNAAGKNIDSARSK